MIRFKKLIQSLAGHPSLRSMMTGAINLLTLINPSLQNYNLPTFISDSTAYLLDEIPSETTPQERRFLYWLFSSIWSGENNVIEIGPFMGGQLEQ